MNIIDSCLGPGRLHPSFYGFREGYKMVKLVKRTVLYPTMRV